MTERQPVQAIREEIRKHLIQPAMIGIVRGLNRVKGTANVQILGSQAWVYDVKIADQVLMYDAEVGTECLIIFASNGSPYLAQTFGGKARPPSPAYVQDTRWQEMAPSYSVSVPLEIRNHIKAVDWVFLRFKTRPLRTTATGAASGGGQTTSSGGGTTVTSAAGGGQTTSSGGGTTVTSGGADHQHKINIAVDPSPDAGPVYYTVGYLVLTGTTGYTYTSFDGWHTHSVTIGNHTHTVSDHTHSVTIGNHTHTVSDHTHSLTYGIYDDTQYPTTISISINGVDRTAALGGPWAAGGSAVTVDLDITDYIAGATGGINQEHSVVFTCAGGQGILETILKLALRVEAIRW